MLAAEGARVTGVDLSPTMVAEARSRADAAGLGERCTFEVGDATDLGPYGTFDLVVCVTVLQHILSEDGRRRAVEGFSDALRPGGKAIVLEAAPTQPWRASDHAQFRPRTLAEHLRLFRSSGLNPVEITGVDSTLVRKYVLPAYGRLPSSVALPLLALGTALALPLDIALSRALPHWSWHKLFVLQPLRRSTVRGPCWSSAEDGNPPLTAPAWLG